MGASARPVPHPPSRADETFEPSVSSRTRPSRRTRWRLTPSRPATTAAKSGPVRCRWPLVAYLPGAYLGLAELFHLGHPSWPRCWP